ncbi:PQQ-binding-like beta-propeller repeat protein [Streptomyces sp. NPDC050433]|uniref:outer membrane protein assembly factor BamB family protein n=1 Tax=Streptomyces sp. NPDC050433 TaxID=3365615 RepID=UPI0037B71FB5
MGDYRLLARLGAGGMGVVYLGRSPGGRLVAVKVVREHFGRDAHYRARFCREVAAARTVTGTFTAPLLDAAPDARVPWLVMEYLPGLSVREAVEGYGPLPPDPLRLLAGALAEALVGIHRAGLAHRDLKPGNIVLSANGPRVIDFGIARPEDATEITVPGALLGTPGFMSPEQASGAAAGPAGDVFALGTVLLYAATGGEPFDAGDRAATLERVRSARADLDGITDRKLRALVAACHHREPERRLSAAELLNRLGEPAASVHGTRWLPAPLAEAIDRRVAGGEQPPEPREKVDKPFVAPLEPDALPGEATEDPPPQSPLRHRRRLLLALAAVPVAAGAAVVLVRGTGAGGDKPAEPRSGSPKSPSGSVPVPPAVPVARWTTKVLDDDTRSPDLYRAGNIVLARSEGQHDVQALDPRTGEKLWSRATSESGPEGQVTTGPHGVYLFDARAGDSTEEFVLRAVRPESGAVRWTARVPFFPWGTAATGSVLCVAVRNDLRGLDAKNGRPRWTARATGMSLNAGAGLVVAGGDGVLTAVDADSGRIRWTYEMPESPQSALIGDGVVITRDTLGTVYAVHADDGRAAWKQRIDYRGSVRQLGGGMLYVAEADGRIRALRAATGKQVWSREPGRATPGGSFGRPEALGLSGDTLWVRGQDQLVYALDAADGRVLWSYEASAGVGSAADSASGALAVAGLVLLGTTGGNVLALSPPDRSTNRPTGRTE